MHPILFRIPLPHRPLKLWWALLALVVLSTIYGAVMLRKRTRDEALTGLIVAVLAGAGAYYWRGVEYKLDGLPIYSYGVLLGTSLIVGWFLTLGLAERDRLPRETMANCYVITAIAALVGSRILYILTNPSQFDTTADWFALRRGGLVAYGGFVGGYIGSWLYLSRQNLRLMPWADIAVPSLASGLFITRIGCYLYGCDFGTRLSAHAPGWLQKLGSFPHLTDGTLGYDDKGNPLVGSIPYAHHLKMCQELAYKAADCVNLKDHSFPVHPTQIYESLVGLSLLLLLLWLRRHQKFRGQIFFTFVFAYGCLRFLLELWRDDEERGSVPPQLDRYVLISGGLLLFALAFIFGISLGIQNKNVRTAARVLSVVPAIIAFVALKPGQFESDPYNLSTSQFIGLLSAVVVAYFYAKYWEEARKNPQQAMSLGLPEEKKAKKKKKPVAEAEPDAQEAEDEDEDETEGASEAKPKATKKPAEPAKKPEKERKDDEEEEEEGEPEPA
jgi:phosphatidylglycerol:prolipoprotein diacylglycerol transferase